MAAMAAVSERSTRGPIDCEPKAGPAGVVELIRREASRRPDEE